MKLHYRSIPLSSRYGSVQVSMVQEKLKVLHFYLKTDSRILADFQTTMVKVLKPIATVTPLLQKDHTS